MKADYQVEAALPEQEELFYSDSSQEENCIGHLRGDFGHGGDEFWTSWWPHAAEQKKTADFQREFNGLVGFLRQDLLKGRMDMARYLREHPGCPLDNGDSGTVGYIVAKSPYRFCIRCTPAPGSYDFYVYVYLIEEEKQ